MTYDEATYFKEKYKEKVVDSTLMIQKLKSIKTKEEQEEVRVTFNLAEESFKGF